jgi:hypothetical protein
MSESVHKQVKHPGVSLFFLSAVSLFVELLIIRWMSMDIRAFTIFKSFPLVTVYVGLGLGFASGNSNKFGRWFPVALLLFAIEMLLANAFGMGKLVFPSSSFDWQGVVQIYYLIPFMVIFALLLFVPLFLSLTIGSAMAAVFSALKPLTAYTVNLSGALLGSILFALFSFTAIAPWGFLILPAAIMLLVSSESRKGKSFGLLAVIAAVLVAVSACKPEAGAQVFWSPYQRLDLHAWKMLRKDGQEKPIISFDLKSNHSGYQSVMNLTPDDIQQGSIPSDIARLQNRWMLPYQLIPFKDALIVAAGMGGDVGQALYYGAQSIDAVDIDPVILRLGKDLNPLKPYDNPKVNVVCDDARHFVFQCQKKYDLVVFSHLDSHTVLGTSSAVRLDNYVYAKETVARALQLVKPNGLMVLSFWSTKSWFAERLFNTIKSAAGYAPVVLHTHIRTNHGFETDANTVFILGDSIKNGTFRLPESVKERFEQIEIPNTGERMLTDDWPYLYLENKPIDVTYLAVLIEMIAIVLLCSKGILLKPAPAVHWQLFFMGSAFMLMELQLISRLSLLFGSTWVTTSIVVNGILLMILFANGLVLKLRNFFAGKLPVLYGALLISLLISYLLPIGSLLADSGSVWLTYSAICLLTFLPVFFAAIIFAVSFDRVEDSTRALAFNILGAVPGTLCEYSSNYIGIKALLLIVMFFYAVSFVFALRSDRDSLAIGRD